MQMANDVCPFWVGYLLASPIRKLFQNPNKILTPYVKKNMTVLDIGSAMGFFSLPLAEMVGSNGKVICVDLQEKMLLKLKARTQKKNLFERIETRKCSQDSLCLNGLDNQIDFALAFWMIHEVPDQKRFFKEVFASLKNKGHLLVAEPSGHVNKEDFQKTVSIAEEIGFKSVSNPKIAGGHSILLQK
jgi:ubiquinone/menaquinone biosynthesis C-methylase UbiE